MKNYPIPMVPGPVKISPAAFRAYCANFGAGYMEPEYFAQYISVCEKLRRLCGTKNDIIIQSGEAMSILWGAIKSCLHPADRVLCISTGVFGSGFADMATEIGAQVKIVAFGFDETIHDLARIEHEIATFGPKMITAVHCETPSGTLNPLKGVGDLKTKYGIPLFVVDAVASIGCVPVNADEWQIDILMGGSQKGLSLAPSLGFCALSPAAWDAVEHVRYKGYEAFADYRMVLTKQDHPNTPDWNSLAALDAVLDEMDTEGFEQVFTRHEKVARFCRERLLELGYELFPCAAAVNSPSVTAVKLPAGLTFAEFDRRTRVHGLVIGGSYGSLNGKIFRLGHMGTQATMENAQEALAVLEKVILE